MGFTGVMTSHSSLFGTVPVSANFWGVHINSVLISECSEVLLLV